MESEALLCFQQTTRGTGTRRFKVYRTTAFQPVSRLASRFEKYLRRNRFPEEVHVPHWLETEGPLTSGTLATVGEQFRQFTTYHLLAVTDRDLHPFLAVPVAVDVVPALSKAVTVRIYDAADCADGLPTADADPIATLDEDSYDAPLTGAVGEGGPMASLHVRILRAATRLAAGHDSGVAVGDPDVPTAVVPDGDHVARIDLRDTTPLRRVSNHGVFVNYGHEAVPGEDLDDRRRRVLRETAASRYRYARHLWAIRNRTTRQTFADDPESYRDEVEATRAQFFADVIDSFGAAVAPFSSGVYGGAIREDTATRADTFALNGRLEIDAETIGATLDAADADYDPEYDHTAG
jgi:hypothetical protein